MKKKYTSLLFFLLNLNLSAQLYFPPNDSSTWETMSPSELNWCPEKIDSLYELLEDNDTKAFIILKNGKIVLEQYFNDHELDTPWYWASCAKSLTAFLVGIGQQEGAFSIEDAAADYLGEGWTDCTPAQENQITIRNQLTMTTGLDDGVLDNNCTSDTCLVYLADAGDRWAYHNGPYTKLHEVLETSTGMGLNQYLNEKLKEPTGMTGAFFPVNYNNVFYSTARSMARFGLLMLNQGNWNGMPILSDENYFQEMVNTSQDLNESYGYLWWLNGKNSFILPGSQLIFPNSINPNGPDDLRMAIGKNGQFINVVPSQNLVMIRMGNYPGDALVPTLFNDEIWERMNDLECTPVAVELEIAVASLRLSPNPVSDILMVELPESVNLAAAQIRMYDVRGNLVYQGQPTESSPQIDMTSFAKGVYLFCLEIDGKRITRQVVCW